LEGDDEFVGSFGDAGGEGEGGWWDESAAGRGVVAWFGGGDEDDKGEVHGEDGFVFAAGVAFEEEHLFADDFDDFFSLVQEVFLGYGVGGGVD
jgi:hypothetical protein